MHCVDLGESFPTNIWLQKLASRQPRTSPVKFARSRCTDTPGVTNFRQIDFRHKKLARFRLGRAFSVRSCVFGWVVRFFFFALFLTEFRGSLSIFDSAPRTSSFGS